MRNWLLLAIALLACLPLLEVAVRIIDPPQIRSEQRVLLMSAVPLRDAQGGFRFAPHIEVREILVADDRIEYDVRFPTNNLGRVDHRDYVTGDKPAPAYAVVGDSYAMGVEGGEPWLPKLHDETGIELYNFGMGAVGVAEFGRILRDEATRVAFSEIVVVAISDDFMRPLFDPLLEGKELRLCVQGEARDACLARPAVVQLVDFKSDEAEILRRARAAQLAAAADPDGGAVRRLLRHSKFLLLVKRVAFQTLQRGGLHSPLVEQNLEALAAWRSAFPAQHVTFIHVPDKFETARGRYDLDLGEQIKALGIEYRPALQLCKFSVDLYYANDNHPNLRGYRQLGECVHRILDLPAATAVAQ